MTEAEELLKEIGQEEQQGKTSYEDLSRYLRERLEAFIGYRHTALTAQ